MHAARTILLILLIGAAPAISLAQQIAIATYPTDGGALGIAVGPDGALWFTEPGNNHIGRITTAGVITQYQVPTPASFVSGITAGPDGALWFTEYYGGKIGRITTDGAITEYPVPAIDSEPDGITTGPDGALWFTQNCFYCFTANYANIGRITTAGVITEYAVTSHSDPWSITAGPDGALWFTDLVGDGIERINTAGTITMFPVPIGGANTYGIAAGPDGALWFTQSNVGTIGRITTEGVITLYPLPSGSGPPEGITTGPDGSLWFTAGPAIGRINTSGAITQYPTPGAIQDPVSIVEGPDGALWFTSNLSSEIGEAVFVTASLSVTPARGHYRSTLTFTGSGFAPNEKVQIYYKGVGSDVLASATADSNGSFTATGKAPQSPYGPRIFLGMGQNSGKLGAATFSMLARLAVQPGSGPPGTTASVTGYGFGSREMVEIYWNRPYTSLGVVQAGIYGTLAGAAALTFTVPLGALSGVDGVFGYGETTQAVGPGSFVVQ